MIRSEARKAISGTTTKSGKRRYGNVQCGTALMTQAEIGRRLGVCLQRIQQIEKRALRKIQQAIENLAAAEGMTVEEWLSGE